MHMYMYMYMYVGMLYVKYVYVYMYGHMTSSMTVRDARLLRSTMQTSASSSYARAHTHAPQS